MYIEGIEVQWAGIFAVECYALPSAALWSWLRNNHIVVIVIDDLRRASQPLLRQASMSRSK